MNQHLADDVLYISPVGKEISELRMAGDRSILYTESADINRRFKDWEKLIQRLPYIQSRSLVGVDLYFPKSEAKALVRSLQQFYSQTLKERGSAR